MNEPFVDDLWCIFQPTAGNFCIFLSSFGAARFSQTLFGSPNDSSTSEHVTSSQLGVEHLSTLEKRRVSSLTFASFTPGSQALSTPNFPVDGGLEQGSLGWKCWRFCGILQRRGKTFVRNFPTLKWIDYFLRWMVGTALAETNGLCFFSTRGRLEMVRRLYILVRLLIQFSVFSFPGFNNADFCGPKRLQFKEWFAEFEFRRLTEFIWCFMLFFMFDWSIFDYLVLFLCCYVNGE